MQTKFKEKLFGQNKCVLEPLANFPKADISFMSVCLSTVRRPLRTPVHPSAWNNSALTGQLFLKYISTYFEHLSRKFEFHLNLTTITGILQEDLRTLMTKSR